MTPTLRQLLTPCKQLRAAHDSGPRRAGDIRIIVLHSTEGGSARSVAEFFHTTAQASTHLVVDDIECYRCVPDLYVPWGAPGANRRGLHVEHCGYAAWTRDEWLGHYATIERSAAKCAKWAYHYRIPRRFLTVEQLAGGSRGFCTHADASAAFPPNDGHHDPGPNFPKDAFMRLVRQFYRQLNTPPPAP